MSYRLRQIMTLIVVMSILGVLLAACGGGGDQTGAEQAPAANPEAGGEGETDGAIATSPEPVAAAGDGTTLPQECTNVQLEFWNPFTGPDGPYMGELVQQFSDEQENIDVTMTTQSEYYTQLSTAASSNTLPDVAIIHADQVATQAFRNILRPMDDLVEQIGVSGDNFPEAVWNAGEVADTRYSIPLDIHPMTMFYNADLLSQAGINEPPQTREDFEQAAEAMTGNDNFGFMITTGFPVRQIFEMLLYQFGGTSFNEDGTEATWNSEAGVQALEWMKNAQANYSEPNLEVDAELNAFKAGYVGMVWNGIWQTTNLTGEAVGFNGQGTAVPQIGDQMAVWAGSHQLALPAQAESDPCTDAAAGIFIRYLLDNSVTWAQAGQIPASNDVRESEEFQALEPQAAIAPSVEHAFFPPSVPGIGDAYVPLDEAVSAIMSGTATDIQATLDDAANRANQILADNQQRYGEAPGGTE